MIKKDKIITVKPEKDLFHLKLAYLKNKKSIANMLDKLYKEGPETNINQSLSI